MNLYVDILFFCAQVVILGGVLFILWGLGVIVHERYVVGNVDAFKAERRMGPADRRAELPGH